MFRKIYAYLIYLFWVSFSLITWNCHSIKNNPPSVNLEALDWIKDLSIYEIHINVFTKVGNFRGLINELPRIQKLGVKAVAIAPYPWCDTLVLKDLKKNRFPLTGDTEPLSKYGTAGDFFELLDSLHAKKIKVIVEWNASTFSKQLSVQKNLNSIFLQESTNDSFASECVSIDLQNKTAQEKSLQYIQDFATTYPVDGFIFYQTEKGPLSFYQSLTTSLTKIRPLLLINGGVESSKEVDGLFHLKLNYELENRILNYSNTLEPQILLNYLDSLSKNTTTHFVNFFYSFTEQLYTGSDVVRFGNYHKLLAALVQFLPGVPMIYNGQEVPVYADIKPDNVTVIEFTYDFLVDFYRILFLQKQHNSALWLNGQDNKPTSIGENQGVLAYERKQENSIIVGFFNLSDRPSSFTITKDYTSFYYLKNQVRVNFIRGQQYNLGAGQYIIITNTL